MHVCTVVLLSAGMVAAAPLREYRAESLVQHVYDGLAGQFSAPETTIKMEIGASVRTALVQENMSPEDVLCEHDVSSRCPIGWLHAGSGYCEAPHDYVGTCHRRLSYSGLTPWEKLRRCEDVTFSCRGDCEKDFSKDCPQEWLHDGQQCIAPAGYTGPCVGRKSFSRSGLADRRAWSQSCGVEWPCRPRLDVLMRTDVLHSPEWLTTDCAMSFGEDCPARWTKAGNYCQAPRSKDVQRCSVQVDMSNFTTQSKRAFAGACGAPWPCVAV